MVKLFDNTAILAVGDDEKKVNVTKLIKLRDFCLPHRDLKGRAMTLSEPAPVVLLEETFERAKELTDKLLLFKRDGKIWGAAKKAVKQSFLQGPPPSHKPDIKYDEKIDIDELVDDKVAEAAQKMRELERTLKKISSTRITSKLHLPTTNFTPGNFAVAWVISSNRLVKILSQRVVLGIAYPGLKSTPTVVSTS